MINQDAIDLYSRVTVGAKVVVLGSGAGNEIAIGPGSSQPAPQPQAQTALAPQAPRMQPAAVAPQRAPLGLNPYPMDRTW